MKSPLTISVVVPTYRRPEVLRTCLHALARQEHPPVEVIVARRSTDDATAAALRETPDLGGVAIRDLEVGAEDNFGRSLHAGILATRGELIALTDDDSEAPADWTAKLAAGFVDDRVGGVGGRDLVEGHPPGAPTVGLVTWYGRLIGNHHIGVGPARDVDVLKGVNCCFRGDLLRRVGVDARLRGKGTVINTELSFCLPIRRAGYRLVYDPSITLQHHIAPRGDGDANNRGGFDADAFGDTVFNETLLVREHLPPTRRWLYSLYGVLVGSTSAPGVLCLSRSIARFGTSQGVSRFLAAAAARRSVRGVVSLPTQHTSTKEARPTGRNQKANYDVG